MPFYRITAEVRDTALAAQKTAQVIAGSGSKLLPPRATHAHGPAPELCSRMTSQRGTMPRTSPIQWTTAPQSGSEPICSPCPQSALASKGMATMLTALLAFCSGSALGADRLNVPPPAPGEIITYAMKLHWVSCGPHSERAVCEHAALLSYPGGMFLRADVEGGPTSITCQVELLPTARKHRYRWRWFVGVVDASTQDAICAVGPQELLRVHVIVGARPPKSVDVRAQPLRPPMSP